MPALDAIWRGEIDAVEFYLEGGYRFVVHRNVFRTLRGGVAEQDVCLAFAEENAQAFRAAARARIEEATSPSTRAFHLNSRHVRRAMTDAPLDNGDVKEPAPR